MLQSKGVINIIGVKISAEKVEELISTIRSLNSELKQEARNPEIDIDLQRSLVKEAQKIDDETRLIEESIENPVEIKVYVYEMYNSIPTDLKKIYERITEYANDTKNLIKLREIIERISKELEKFWYFVNA